MSEAYIFGAGGHARVIASMIRHRHTSITFVTHEGHGDELLECAFYERIDARRRAAVYLGVGSNAARRKIFARLLEHGITPAICIPDHGFVARDAEIGAGTVLCPGSVVMTGARIGRNVIVNTLSSVDHDCTVGDHSQITAGVTFGGTVSVGDNCFFGVKSAVIPNRTLGNNVIVMAGALVAKDFPSDVTLGGYPAVVMRG